MGELTTDEPVPPGRPVTTAFLLATVVSVAGTAVGMLGATGVTSEGVGGIGGTALTGAFLVLLLLFAALPLPYAARVGQRWGVRRTLAGMRVLQMLAWGVSGVALVGWGWGPVALLLAAPLLGVASGMTTVLGPSAADGYVPRATAAHAYALMSAASGVGFALGSLVGGWLLDAIGPAWGPLINAMTTLPLVLVLVVAAPVAAMVRPRAAQHAWRDAARSLRSDALLRRAVVVGMGVALFVAPLLALMVPIARQLDQPHLLRAAGILTFAISVGNIASPRVVRAVTGRLSNQAGAAFAAGCAAVSILVVGIVCAVMSGGGQLALMAVACVVVGAWRYATRALSVGVVKSVGEAADRTRLMATFLLACGLAAPVGIALWCALMTAASVSAAMLVAGVGMLALATPVFLRARHEPVALPTG